MARPTRGRIRRRPGEPGAVGLGVMEEDRRPVLQPAAPRKFQPTPTRRALLLTVAAAAAAWIGLAGAFSLGAQPRWGLAPLPRARSGSLPDADVRTCSSHKAGRRLQLGVLLVAATRGGGGSDGLDRHLAASLWEDGDEEEAPVEQLLNPQAAAAQPRKRRGRPRKAKAEVVVEEEEEEEEEEGEPVTKGTVAAPLALVRDALNGDLAQQPSSPVARFLPQVSRGAASRGVSSSSGPAAAGSVATGKAPQHMQPSKREERLRRLEGMLAASSAVDDDEEGEGADGEEEAAASRAHTVDLYVPPADLEVMLAWADRLAERRLQRGAQWSLPSASAAEGRGKGPHQQQQQARAGSKALVALSKEQRLLSLAQMFLGMEKLRAEMADAEPGLGAVTPRELASRLGLRPSEVEGFYKLGLRARSYILMSMHGLILSLARRYAAAFGDAVDKAELVQEGYKGAMLSVERYDPVKAATSGATFRAFAHVYVMSAMITAARKELHLSPSGAQQPARDPTLLRLPPGAPVGPRRGHGLLLPSSSAAAGAGAVPQLGMGRAAAASEAAALPPVLEDEDEEDEQAGEFWYPEDEEEALEAASDAGSVRRPGRRPLRKIRRVARFGVGQEAAVDGLGAGRGRRAELFGVDPATSRPAYEILDESKRARDVGLFLARAAQELSPLDMQVLSLVYGLDGNVPMKRAQVARKLGLHASAVSKSEKRALRKLREMLEIA